MRDKNRFGWRRNDVLDTRLDILDAVREAFLDGWQVINKYGGCGQRS